MSNMQTNFGGLIPAQPPVKLKRPELPLGPMTGDPEYIQARAESLVETFKTMLSKDFKLINGAQGCTDCETFIQAPLDHPEGYLITEHELSHNLFGTDLMLTTTFKAKAIERLLKRAGIISTHPDADAYKPKLDQILHMLWNVLEDHRVRWLWALLYPGGGDLLRRRWEDICQYDYDEVQCETDLITYLARRATGVETPGASDKFKECGKHMIAAKNLVEGVDAESCLAITARLIDDIADELLDKYPPSREEEAKQKLKALMSAAAGSPPPGQGQKDNRMGESDIAQSSKAKKPTAGQMKRIQQVLTASQDDGDEQEQSSFSALMQAGAERMEDKLEEARQAMASPKLSPEEEEEELLQAACRATKAAGRFVTPEIKLPAPSRSAANMKHQLMQLRMKKIRKAKEDGENLDLEAYLDARLNKELYEGKFFTDTVREAGFELLLLGDVSGSMLGGGMSLLEQAIADTEYACGPPLRVNLTLWTFSDITFFFKKLGSPRGARGQVSGGTNMVQALDIAYEWAKASKSTRAVILMTDGMPTSLRGRNSTGNALTDLHAVLEEMRLDGIIVSVLAIGSTAYANIYDTGFGRGKYALLSSLQDLAKALPNTASQLVAAHIKKGRV